jgi:hypothetical protein
MNRCYFDGEECDCGAYDVAGDCPRDTYVHDEDMLDEGSIEEIYHSTPRGHDDEIDRF